MHRSADIERQTLRTQQLGGLAFQLKDFNARAEIGKTPSAGLVAARARVLDAANAKLALIRKHGNAEGDRLQGPYGSYVSASSRAFDEALANGGRLSDGTQQQVESTLTGLESQVDAEIGRLAHSTRVTNPQARLALIVAAVAAALLVGLLIWQFEMQRRAGRIDRDNAERSKELVRLRDDFAAAVSHELRTPLTSILGYLELIRDNESANRSPEDDAYLAIVQRNAERLLRLVSDLLLVAEVEDRVLALHVEDVALAEIAAECVEAAQPAAAAQRIELTLHNESPGEISGDPIRLAQMMDNLVSNAIKFTPDGGRVKVTTSAVDGHIVLEVADSGPGIAPADQAQLFDRFFRTRDAAVRATTGTGLGLTITKAIVEAHDGTIGVESAVGAGTTFRVELPQSATAR